MAPYNLGPIDHPLIIIAQIIAAGGLFRYFFYVNRDARPVPQIIAALAFAVLTNLTFRIMHYEWFWIADIIQYGLWALLIVTGVLARHKAEKKAKAAIDDLPLTGQIKGVSDEVANQLASTLNAVRLTSHPKPQTHNAIADFFDNNETKFNWTVGFVLAGLLAYYCVNLYNDRVASDQAAQKAAIEANTQVTQQYNQQQEKASEERQQVLEQVDCLNQQQSALLSTVASVTATQQTILSGQQKLATQQNKRGKTLTNLSIKVDTAKRDIKLIKDAIPNEINRSVDPNKLPKPEKKSLWKRLFSSHAVVDDSLDYTHVRAVPASDSLLLY